MWRPAPQPALRGTRRLDAAFRCVAPGRRVSVANAVRHLGGWLDEVSGRKGCETPETVQHQVKNHKATSRRVTPKAGLRVVTTLISTSWKRGASLRPLGYNSKFPAAV